MTDELADDSDDEKRLYKAESRAGSKVKEAKAKAIKKKPLRKYPAWPRNAFNTSPYGHQINSMAANSVNTSQSPIQAGISKPVPPSHSQALGPCFQCGKLGHFRRACPLLTQNPK